MATHFQSLHDYDHHYILIHCTVISERRKYNNGFIHATKFTLKAFEMEDLHSLMFHKNFV